MNWKMIGQGIFFGLLGAGIPTLIEALQDDILSAKELTHVAAHAACGGLVTLLAYVKVPATTVTPGV